MSGTPLTDAINALTTYANTVTGQSDTDLSSAVATLASGYGGGGSNTLVLVAGGANAFNFPSTTPNIEYVVVASGTGLGSRFSLWDTSGTFPAKYYFSNESASLPVTDSVLYPIPIESGASNITPTTTHSGQYDIFFVQISGSTLTIIQTTGWQAFNTKVAIPTNATHIVIGFRVNASNTAYTISTIPTDIDLIYE